MEKVLRNHKSDIIFAAIGFALLATVGMFEATKGTMIPQIKEQFAVDYTSISALIMLGSCSYILMVFFGGLLADLKGQKLVILIGSALIASSLFLIQFAGTFTIVCILFFTMYLGFGCMEVASSLVARLNSKYGAIIMSLLHFSYGAGMIAGPFFATNIVMSGGAWSQAFAFIAIPFAVCLIISAVVPFKKDIRPKAETASVKGIKWDKRIWVFTAILGLTLVSQFGVVNWFVNYLQQGWGVAIEQSSALMTYFFIVFALGRLAGGFITQIIGYYKTMLLMSISMAALFSTGILLGSNGIGCFIAFGFFIAVFFPTVMVGLMEEYKEKIASIMGIVISTAGGINLAATWVMGMLNDRTGVVFGFNTVIAYILAIVALIFVLGRLNRRIKEKPAA